MEDRQIRNLAVSRQGWCGSERKKKASEASCSSTTPYTAIDRPDRDYSTNGAFGWSTWLESHVSARSFIVRLYCKFNHVATAKTLLLHEV
jgi:hypothetical protein